MLCQCITLYFLNCVSLLFYLMQTFLFFWLFGQQGLELIVQHEDHSTSDCSQCVGASTLEESRDAALRKHLFEAITSPLVGPLLFGLLGLHLETTTDGVKRVRCVPSGDGHTLRNGKLRTNAGDARVLLVWVHRASSVVEAKVNTSVRDDTCNGDTKPIIETKKSLRSCRGLLQAVGEPVKVSRPRSDVRGQPSPRVVQRIDNAQRTGTGKTTTGHVDPVRLCNLRLGVGLWEDFLDCVLEGKVKCLSGKVPNHVGEVTSPEGGNALLRCYTREAVDETCVPRDLP